MRWERAAIWAAAGIWGGIVLLWPFSSNVNRLRNPQAARSGEDLYKSQLTTAGFGLLGVRFYETTEGRKRWNIEARFAELHRKENYAFLKEVDAEFFAGKTGNVIHTLSDYGRSLMDKQIVELEGNVRIRSKRGYLFTMERLNYLSDVHRFESKDPVEMRGPDVEHPAMFLKGTGLLANIDHEHFILKRNVTAQRRLSAPTPTGSKAEARTVSREGDWLRIQSRSGEFFTDENRAIFTGKVKSILPQIAIDSDKFELNIGEQSELIYATGNVVLKTSDRVGRADSAAIEIGSSRIVLEGRAQIDSKDNQLRGRRIVLYTDDDRIEVEQAEGNMGP